jgi:hypothetical protein
MEQPDAGPYWGNYTVRAEDVKPGMTEWALNYWINRCNELQAELDKWTQNES